MTIPSLLTVKQFAEKHQAFPEGGLRNRIFHANTNGMHRLGVIVRNGRRVLIDEERFFSWLEEQNECRRRPEVRVFPPVPRRR